MTATSTPRTPWRTRIVRASVRAAFALVAAALLAAPFGVAWYLHVRGLQVSEQFYTPASSLAADQDALAETLRSELPDRAAPVVLAYHDIRPMTATEDQPDPAADPRHHLVVTPEAFDAQLTALRAAGYTSITSDQYVDYLAGGEVPERSVLLTFDDGTHGLWTYADKILERHGMHAVSFLITGNVGAKRPYYLSWQEIERMAHSGRWDFQSHTRKMHARLPIDAAGTLASEMTHRRWLFEKNRPETLDEFEGKIRTDLLASVQDIVDHGLPRPTLFAFPFSDGYDDDRASSDPQAAATALTVVREIFAGAFNNAPPQPLPAGARAAAVGMTGRIELTVDSTVEGLLESVRAKTPVTPGHAAPSRRPDLWTRLSDDTRAPLRIQGKDVRFDGPGRWSGAAYGREATADWASYTATVTVGGLAARGVENGALIARVGTGEEVSVQVSAKYARVSVGLGPAWTVLRDLPLRPGDRHTVTMEVSPTAIGVVVDGSARMSVPAVGGPAEYGGIGLSSSRTTEVAPWPVFTDLSVTPGRDVPNVKAGVGVPTRS